MRGKSHARLISHVSHDFLLLLAALGVVLLAAERGVPGFDSLPHIGRGVDTFAE